MTTKQLQEEVLALKRKNPVTILAHYYQPIEIQEIADYVGDSLGLSRTANKTNSEYIIFAGVDFMAETASIINQDKHVIIPNYESCCPMAAFLTPEMVIKFKKGGISATSQSSIKVFYEDEIIGEYFDDILVDNKVIVEIKAAKSIAAENEAQLLSYLKATDIEVGLLLNFGPKSEIKRKVFDNFRK